MAHDDEEDFTYPALVNRWRRERAATALSKMDGRFYESFDERLRALREEYTREHALNPATPKVLILQDELMNLQRVRDDLYDLRERKIVTAALIAARGGNPDRSTMTKEEDILFDEILKVLRDARRNLLRRGQPSGKMHADELPKDAPRAGPPTPPEPVAAQPAAATGAAQPAAVLAERAPAADAAPEAPLPGAPAAVPVPAKAAEAVVAEEAAPPRRLGPPRVLVRMKAAVAPFVGTDLRQYRLAAEDVAAVPREIAHALVARGVAQALGS